MSTYTLYDTIVSPRSDRKLNKLEKAKNELIDWIHECKLLKYKIDKKEHKEHPKTTLDFYLVGRVLGKGTFGKVNLAVHKLSGKLVAIKSLHKNYLTNLKNNERFKNEIEILRNLKHRNILRLYETFSTENYLVLVMELCSGGDLLSYVRKRRKVPEELAKITFRQIIDGLKYCHSKGIIHCDIKLENILLDEYGHVKIGDFGVSKKVDKGKWLIGKCGTPIYIAPEVLDDAEGYEGEKIDIWSAGVLLYAMVYGDFPFKANNIPELEKVILAGKYKLTSAVSSELNDLLMRVLKSDPSERVTIPELLTHPWIQNINPMQTIFYKEELEQIKKEYHLNMPAEDSAESSIDYSIFTEHALDNTEHGIGEEINSDKSFVLDPYNSLEKDNVDILKNLEAEVLPRKTLKFSSKLREYNRKYERENNSKLDNGIYLPNSIPKSESVSKKYSQRNAKIQKTKTTQPLQKEFQDREVKQKMERMGFDESYVNKSLKDNQLNAATTLYYLLMDEI